MGVNSAFKGFFNQRRLLSSGMALVMVGIFFIASSFTKLPDRELQAKQVNLILRQIGDRLLLQAGDSTSRVLPVTEIKEGTFLLKFENRLVFNHDSLMMLSLALLPKSQFPSGYSVTVHDCINADIVYGFQVNTTAPDILACRGRRQPSGCYMIEFAFHDFYENAEPKKADIGPLAKEPKSVSVDPPEANPKPEEVTTTTDHGIDQRTEEPKLFKANTPEANRKPDEFKTTTFLYPLNNLVFSGMLVLLGAGVTLLIGHFRKILTPVPVQYKNHVIINEPVPELPGLGKFLFDVKDQRLLLGSEMISLTDKECRILELLNEDFGELIPRETLMQKVWIDEGVITGRSLDMFVSKLRKKLSSDPALRITNVHGKGYKLEIPGV